MPLHLKTGLGRGSNQGVNSTLKYFSFISDMEEFIKGLQALIFTQSPTLELCWKFHPQVASKFSQTIRTCLLHLISMVYKYNFFHSRKVVTRDEAYSFVSDKHNPKCFATLFGGGKIYISVFKHVK